MMDVQERPRLVLEHQPEANHYDTLERDRMAAEQSTQTVPESWLPVPGYEGMYEVSDRGRARSLPRTVEYRAGIKRRYPGTVLEDTTKGQRYSIVELHKGAGRKKFSVHRLVMLAFVGPCPEGMEVCHNNGDPTDNRLTNLRYATRSENHYDKRRHGTDQHVNKTHCIRGHRLDGGNLRAAPKKAPHIRRCRACKNAQTYISRHPELKRLFQEISDQYYAGIVGDDR